MAKINLVGTYKLTLSLFFSLSLCELCYAQQYPGTSKDGYYRVEVDTRTGIQTESSTNTWHFRVVSMTDSNVTIECTLVNSRTKSSTDLFDTEDPVTCRLTNSKELETLALLNRPFLYRVAKDSAPDQPGIEAIFKERSVNWQIQDDLAGILQQNARGYLASEMYMLLPRLKKQGLAPDSSLHRKDTVAGGGYEQQILITRITPQDAAKQPLQEDVKTAIVLASHFSHALFNGPEADSAKLNHYFNRFDPELGKADFYRLIKLDLLTSNIRANFEQYDSLLVDIPDSLLAPYQSHLFNKAQKMINIDTDSAYQVIRYLSKYPSSLRSWVQESFAQAFMHHSETMDEIKTALMKQGLTAKKADQVIQEGLNGIRISKLLINKLVQDTDAVIRNEVYPLYLWTRATQTSNKDSLLRIAAELERISDSGQYSNRYRYGLLVCKQLLASGDTTAATHLLDNQVAAMEQTVHDSTNKERFAEKNMLAYAFKLNSVSLHALDPRAAMDDLSKAAYYSPGSVNENPYRSFYDRVFLDSKESYRPEYAEALIRQGNTKDGLLMLSSQINMDPLFIGELQQAFATNYPQLDFYRFFNDGVVKAWRTAPDFSLKSPDGKKTYTLGDYRGKWLLIDFWGTWCGPCREDFPKINDLVKNLGARHDLAVLSIACGDQAVNVTRFLADNKYIVPAVMSDVTVERKYEVSAYPSKFLISPSGTMLALSYNQDWEKIVQQITSLQPKKLESKLTNAPAQ